MANLMDILQSGPIPLNELNLRTAEEPKELVREIEELRKKRVIVVKGPHENDLLALSPEDIANSSDTIVELSWGSLKQSLFSA